jgi:S-adenosylmethionine/arginine decarboxylase-like enzyme
MHHFMMDGYQGYRSRFDDIRLVNELLQEIPYRLGTRAVMPPFLLPYYDGVEPEDAGISAFVFLDGGHFTLHTFSYRECFFADLVSRHPIDRRRLRYLLEGALPCETSTDYLVNRVEPGDIAKRFPTIDATEDFGPHFMLDLEGYTGPSSLESIFNFLETLPPKIDMTPIMRPYVLPLDPQQGASGIISGLTMIAESHIALHVNPATQRAHFDIFSCRFFNPDDVLPAIRELLPAASSTEILTARGSRHRSHRTERPAEIRRARSWMDET